MYHGDMTRRWTIVIAALLFALGIVLRLPHLGAFLTPDEQRIWTTLTGEFMTALLHQDWAATATSGYPGVTTTWAGSLGLTLQWLFDRPPDVTTLAEMADTLLTTPNRLDMLPWMRLGVALLSAAGIVIVFLLARRLFGDAVALLAASLIGSVAGGGTDDQLAVANDRRYQRAAPLFSARRNGIWAGAADQNTGAAGIAAGNCVGRLAAGPSPELDGGRAAR